MLTPLSPEGQDFYDKQDVDAFLHDWQIPLVHRFAYEELKEKGYLVPGERTVMGADGEHTGTRSGFVFAPEIIQSKDQEMFR